MNFEVETARTRAETASELAAARFAGRLAGYQDSVYTDAGRCHVFAVCGLASPVPAAGYLLAMPELQAYLGDREKDYLLKVDTLCLDNGNQENKLDPDTAAAVKGFLARLMRAPGELNDLGELQLDLQSPSVGTHYAVNLLLGRREGYDDPLQSTPKSVLDGFGRGSFRGRQEKQVLATRYELNPDINGEPANRQFYLSENGRQIFYSADAFTNVKSAHCRHGVNHTEITFETECGLRIRRLIFILPQQPGFPDAVEVQRVTIENLSGRTRNLRLTATGMFGITDPNTLTSDIVYANVVAESELYCQDGHPAAMTVHHKPKACDSEKRFAMLVCDGQMMDEFCSNAAAFLGRGSYEHPENLARLDCSHTRRGAAFFAMAKSFTLQDAPVTIDLYAGMSTAPEDVRPLFDEQLQALCDFARQPENLTAVFQTMLEEQQAYRSFLQIHTGDPQTDAYLSRSLPFQVLYQTYVSRSFAWTQKAYRETGFREIQDLYASMYYFHAQGKDALIRELLSAWIVNVFPMGYAYHNFTTRGKEPGMCSDDQLWLVQAVYRYVTLSNDTAFLRQEFPMAGSNRTRTLLETLKAILLYSGRISVGKHRLPLLDTADWNDTLRLDRGVMHGPEKEQQYRRQIEQQHQPYGAALQNTQSESVMNGFLLVKAAEETVELAELAEDQDLAELAEDICEETRDNLRKHAWKETYYARCLINDDRSFSYLGAPGDGLSADSDIDGTFYLNSFSWALLSGCADDRQITAMLEHVEKYLKTPAGLKLCTPVEYDRLGIVTGTSFYFPGDRENGGVFKHAAMMAVTACLQAARSTADSALAMRLRDLAFFMIEKTLPCRTMENPFVLKGNPRFCTQYNNSITGENIGPILSGTASWLTLALYEICGLEFHGDTLRISPVLQDSQFAYDLQIGDTVLHVEIDGSASFRARTESTYVLDGQPAGAEFRFPEDHKEHSLRVML